MQAKYQDGEPCDHKGCLHHLTHPCEGCGRLGGISGNWAQAEKNRLKEIQDRYNYCHNTFLPKLETIGKVVHEDIPYLLAALKEAQRRERVLREALDIAAKHISQDPNYDICPSDKGYRDCCCRGTIVDVYHCWINLWNELASSDPHDCNNCKLAIIDPNTNLPVACDRGDMDMIACISKGRHYWEAKP